MSKIGLVLEGGGMRGAYTAGALSWFLKNNIYFDYSVGISSGAVHLCSYLLKNESFLFDISTKYMVDKRNVGIASILRERRYVGYHYMFQELLRKQLNYDITPLHTMKQTAHFGAYNCENGKVLFFNQKDLDSNLELLKATCTLPIAGKIVHYKDYELLDGGISCMVPIEQSIRFGNDKHFVISTKEPNYIRKEASSLMKYLMHLNYLKYPNVYQDYAIRHIHYHEQVAQVEALEKEGLAFFLRPSVHIPVKRFSGDYTQLEKLYELGYQDMERQKEKILQFLQ